MFPFMNERPAMTDTHALARNRTRATPAGRFLHQVVADEVDDRLMMVNRAFTAAAIVTSAPDFWHTWRPDAWLIPDHDMLDLPVNTHDLLVHTMALHWANDPVGQLVQMRRALKPDGLMIAAFFGGRTLHELRTCLAEAEAEITGGLSPRIAPMGELRDLGGLLQRAGFALPVADSQTHDVAYDDAWHLMRDIRAMGEGNALLARPRHFTKRAVLDRAATLYQQHFSRPDGRISTTFDIIYLTGWAPADTQQKALRPGSAAQSLAAALGTSETPLPD